MINTERQNILRVLVKKAFDVSGECEKNRIKSATEYILLNASDIYQRIDEYNDFLIYSSIELELYRDGFCATARCFNEIWLEEYSKNPKQFKKRS